MLLCFRKVPIIGKHTRKITCGCWNSQVFSVQSLPTKKMTEYIGKFIFHDADVCKIDIRH